MIHIPSNFIAKSISNMPMQLGKYWLEWAFGCGYFGPYFGTCWRWPSPSHIVQLTNPEVGMWRLAGGAWVRASVLLTEGIVSVFATPIASASQQLGCHRRDALCAKNCLALHQKQSYRLANNERRCTAFEMSSSDECGDSEE